MDAINYAHSAKQAKRIKKFINEPDSSSGVVTVPKVIASGETITIPAGRVAILPDLQVDGDLVVDGDLFIPTGSMTSQVIQKVTSTDNAVVRFNGTTGDVQNSNVIIDDSGNVGIGTNSPSNFAGYNALTITGENTSCGGVIELNNADGSSKAHMFNNGDTFIIGTVTNHQVRIRAGATNRLTIEANGHTTVGAPIVSESTGAQLRVEAPAANDSSTASILISRYSDNYSSAMWHNYDSSYNSESFNLSVSTAEGGTSLNGIYRKYSVLGNGMHKWFGATTLSNPMTLNSNGNLLVGTTTDNGIDKLQVNGSISQGEIPGITVDLNTLKTLTKTYVVTPISENRPIDDYGYLEIIVHGAGFWVMQRFTTLGATGVGAGRVFVRCLVGGTWAAWVEK